MSDETRELILNQFLELKKMIVILTDKVEKDHDILIRHDEANQRNSTDINRLFNKVRAQDAKIWKITGILIFASGAISVFSNFNSIISLIK